MKILIPTVFLVLLSFACTKNERTQYIIDDLKLVPEGIAYSPIKGNLYVTSILKSKIITVDILSGEQSDFIEEKEAGFLPGVGILVDDKRGLVHAIGGDYLSEELLSSLFTFDINSNELKKEYKFTNTENAHFLNDLILDKEGNLYLTDTKASAVYQIKVGSDSLELFIQSDEIQYPNGIAISDDNSKLYVASFNKGVRSIDIATKEILNEADGLEWTQGIDGLEFYKNNLYAIQNGIKHNSDNFRKLNLDASQENIVSVDILDSHTKELRTPLTFCIVEDRAIVIANSNLQYLNQEDFTFSEPDSLRKTKLLIYDLE